MEGGSRGRYKRKLEVPPPILWHLPPWSPPPCSTVYSLSNYSTYFKLDQTTLTTGLLIRPWKILAGYLKTLSNAFQMPLQDFLKAFKRLFDGLYLKHCLKIFRRFFRSLLKTFVFPKAFQRHSIIFRTSVLKHFKTFARIRWGHRKNKKTNTIILPNNRSR